MARLEDQMIRVASKSPVVKKVAERLADEMRRVAADHVDTGQLLKSIKVEERPGPAGTTTQVVTMSRENLMAIEKGHWAGKGENKRWVDGLEIVSRSVDALKRGEA